MAEPLLRGLASYEIEKCRTELLANLGAEWPSKSTRPRETFIPGTMQPSTAAFRFLMAAAADWYRPLTMIYTAARIHPAEGQALVRELQDYGLVTLHQVKTFRPGGQIMILLPTGFGIEQMRQARVEFMPIRGDGPHGSGDATHIYYQNLIARWLREHGWTAEISISLGSKQVDVGATRDDRQIRHAYEVVNEGLEKELVNLDKDLRDGWQKVVFCVGTKAIQEELDALVRQECWPCVADATAVQYRTFASFAREH